MGAGQGLMVGAVEGLGSCERKNQEDKVQKAGWLWRTIVE